MNTCPYTGLPLQRCACSGCNDIPAKGSCASACSLPSYLKTCRPPFFRVGEQIFGKCKDGDAIALDIRGWGRLTNASSKITEDEACNMQDEFGDWVCKALNAAAENV
jgi:hypothetical protein